MCLSSRLTRKAQREAVAKLPEWITVWKVFSTVSSQLAWRAETRSRQYVEGGEYKANETTLCEYDPRRRYQSGFHAFATKKGAEAWGGYYIIPCKIKRLWITAIGEQVRRKVYVTKKIKIPSPKQYFKTHK